MEKKALVVIDLQKFVYPDKNPRAGYAVHILSDCVTSYDKKKLSEMMEYYASKGCTVARLDEVM